MKCQETIKHSTGKASWRNPGVLFSCNEFIGIGKQDLRGNINLKPRGSDDLR